MGIDDAGEAYISIYDLSTTNPLRRLTFGGHNRFPVWSGDSQSVAFQSDREGDLAIFTQRADGFVHGIVSDPIDDEFMDLMKKNRAVYVSTLSLFEACADISEWTRRLAEFDQHGTMKGPLDFWKSPEAVRQFHMIYNGTSYVSERMPVLRQNLKQLFAAGVPIVTGTDTGFPGVVAGVSSLMEPVLHVQAGLSPQAALQAATINAARMVNREKDMGTVEAGKLADLLLIDANPGLDISNLRKIYRVIKGGVTTPLR